MVRIEALTVALGGRAVVRGVNATLAHGLVGLIGPNGAGKSTLVRALAGLVAPASGEVTIDGDPVRALRPAIRARRIAYLPQGQAVHWPLTVERLVALGRLPHLAPLARMRAADAAAIERALDRTALTALRARPLPTLSGGERARALLARALAVEAPLLLADEPLAALDPRHQLEVMALLRAEADRGVLVIAVLHDLTVAARHCDRLLLLHDGALVADGSPAAVLTRDRLAAVYGIDAWVGSDATGPVIVPRPLR